MCRSVCAVYFLQIAHWANLVDRNTIIASLLDRVGILAPVAMVMLQALQAVALPLQNFFVNYAAGNLLGWQLGFVCSHAGWTLGACLVYWRARFLDNRYLPKRFRSVLGDIDQVFRKHPAVFFVGILVPGISDDLVIYVASLHRSVSFKKYFWTIMLVGWIGKLATAMLGAGVAEHNWWMIGFYALAVLIILPVVGLWKFRIIKKALKRVLKRR